ncbi:MAG: AbrB/MazE/SpoVT family DNA-binding domain-containing protein [Hominimerdicola sp.]
MNTTGKIRRIDSLGRIVLPSKYRQRMDWNTNDAVEIYVEDDKIILQKFKRTCMFCNSSENLIEYRGRTVCQNCLKELGSL